MGAEEEDHGGQAWGWVMRREGRRVWKGKEDDETEQTEEEDVQEMASPKRKFEEDDACSFNEAPSRSFSEAPSRSFSEATSHVFN